MSKIDKEMIKKLTKLSRIDCTPEEQDALLNDLKEILVYFEQLQEVDTKNIPPCNQVLEDMVNVMREDVVGSTMPREVFLANAPSQVGGMIRVPPVLKSNEATTP
jgi:aspartyl-tRNA(Asn)/glutamyl-tRNA(Gln) amidotransferase subunit C